MSDPIYPLSVRECDQEIDRLRRLSKSMHVNQDTVWEQIDALLERRLVLAQREAAA